MSARSKARKRALDFLYEADIKKVSASELFAARGATELSQEPYVAVLLQGVSDHLVKIDELIVTYAQGWIWTECHPLIEIFYESRSLKFYGPQILICRLHVIKRLSWPKASRPMNPQAI